MDMEGEKEGYHQCLGSGPSFILLEFCVRRQNVISVHGVSSLDQLPTECRWALPPFTFLSHKQKPHDAAKQDGYG